MVFVVNAPAPQTFRVEMAQTLQRSQIGAKVIGVEEQVGRRQPLQDQIDGPLVDGKVLGVDVGHHRRRIPAALMTRDRLGGQRRAFSVETLATARAMDAATISGAPNKIGAVKAELRRSEIRRIKDVRRRRNGGDVVGRRRRRRRRF